MIDEALKYHDLGWSVIPLLARDKRPAVGTWRQYQDERPSRETLEVWFRETDHNIGILTGRISGLVVLDLDGEVQDPVDLLDQHGFPIDTAIAQTGKGAHVYYRHPGGNVQNGVRIGRIGGVPVDIRGDGGYVVAPPSIHASGRQYVWLHRPDLGLSDFSDNIRNLVSESVDAERPASTKVSDLVGKPTGEIEAILQGVGSGQRNNAAAKMAGYWLKVTGGDELAAWQAVVLWNNHNEPPLKHNELRRTFVSIVERYRRLPGETDDERPSVPILSGAQWAEAVRDLPPRSGLPTSSLPGIEEVGGIVPRDLLILAGRPGMGKSTAAWGVAIDLGIAQLQKTLIFSTEMTANDVARWMAAKIHRKAPNDLAREEWLATLDKIARSKLLMCDKGSISVDDVIATVNDNPGVRLVIIDHVQRMVWGGDNKNQAIETGAAQLKSLAKDTGCTILLLSQMNRASLQQARPGLQSLRDSGGLEQEADAVCFLWSDADDPTANPLPVKFYWAKNRHGALTEVDAMFHKSLKIFKPMSLKHRLAQIDSELRKKEELNRLLEGDTE